MLFISVMIVCPPVNGFAVISSPSLAGQEMGVYTGSSSDLGSSLASPSQNLLFQ